MKSFSSRKFRAVLLDMDGVLWRVDQPIGDLPCIFESMHAAGLKVLLATNNSTRTPQQYQQKLAGFGVSISADQVITSGIATAFLLKKRFPQDSRVYVLGSEALKFTLRQAGFEHGAQDAAAVVVGLTTDFTYEMFSRATLLINAGADFIGTNPDTTLPSPEGLLPGTGALLAVLEATTGQKPILAGKPYPSMMQMALEKLGDVSPQEILVIGDRLGTDIAFGQRAGCATGLVLTGVSPRADAEQWQPQVDLIAEDLESLVALL